MGGATVLGRDPAWLEFLVTTREPLDTREQYQTALLHGVLFYVLLASATVWRTIGLLYPIVLSWCQTALLPPQITHACQVNSKQYGSH